MGELFGIKVMDGGAVAIVTIVVLMVLTGRLIPRRTYEDLKEERDTWRQAHTVSEEARRDALAQNGELVELSRTGAHVLSSLPRGEVAANEDQSTVPPA